MEHKRAGSSVRVGFRAWNGRVSLACMTAIPVDDAATRAGHIPRPRRSSERTADDVTSIRVRIQPSGPDEPPHRAFGQWLERHMALQDPPVTRNELARRVGISPSSLSRWINGHVRPEHDKLETLARVIGADLDDVLARAGYGRPATEITSLQLAHPLALEIDLMLANNSPLSRADRDMLEKIIDRMIDPHRKVMRRRRSV